MTCIYVVRVYHNVYSLANLTIRYSAARNTGRNMSRSERIYIIVVTLIALAGVTVTYAVVNGYVSIHNTVTMKGIGVGIYTNSSCTQRLNSIDWGLAENGTVKNMTVYIRNEGNAPVTLSMQITNWNPSNANQYISLTWNYSGQSVSVNNGVAVVIFLSIASNIQGIPTFSFDITIWATG
jgi:hypothetical protein